MEALTVAGLSAAWLWLPSLESAVAIAAADWFRLGIVYIHLIACCVAIGLVLTSDLSFAARMLKGDSRQDPGHLEALQNAISWSLVTLWITGIVLVTRDASLSSWDYFLNPKIQAKIVIVCLLTLNGFLLHKAVLPALKDAGALLKLPLTKRALALFAGSVSVVSWFYAAMLGIGRPLNWKYPLTDLLAMYPVFIAIALAGVLLLTAWAAYRSRRTGGGHSPASFAIIGS